LVAAAISTMATRAAVVRLALALVVVLAAVGCRPGGKQEGRSGLLQITLAVQPAPYSGLIAVADEKGFFKKAGLEVALKRYPSGLESLRAMMRGEAQIATVADMAFASTMEEDPSLRAIGTSSGSEIVARKDRNIREPAELKGKRIGYTPGNSSAYFLHTFLLNNLILEKELTMVAVPPAGQVAAIMNGEVDAVAALDVYA
jgi:ABC-type nitrate/sulfonate/bicarbonate transport system substrate-binding protein